VEHLRTGLDLAHRAGATALAERAHGELLTAGVRPRRAVLTGADALTASERRVADLAADGRTNQEIAQTLFVTTRTVEAHLTRTFRKLGIASRTELAGALAG
jgi:DNA-binding CsgD family transcriptional regulator